MELITLAAVCAFLIGFIVFKEVLHFKERDMLTKKLIAKNFIEYTNAEIAVKETENKKIVEHKTPKLPF
jgi:hypothetical protein